MPDRTARSLRGPWAVLAALVMVGFACYGTGVYAFTQFLTPLAQEFGWGRAVTGGAMSSFWVASALVPWIAVWAARVGSRWPILIGALLEGTSLALLAFVQDAWQLYALRVLMGLGKLFMVVPIPIELARQFKERSGLAIGIAYAGWHLGGVVLAPVAQWLIAASGWRHAAVGLGAMVIVLILLLLPWFESRREAGAEEGGPAATPGVRSASTLVVGRPALRNLTIVTMIAYAAGFALLTHISPFLADIGIPAPTIATMVGSIAFAAIAGVLLLGAATQRYSTRALGVLSLLGFAVIALALGAVSVGVAAAGLPMLAATVLLFGFVLGGADAVWIEHLRRLTQANEFPAIYGWWYLTVLVSLTVAPVLAGAGYDAAGSYSPVFAALAASLGVGMAVLRFAVPAGSREQPGAADRPEVPEAAESR